MLKSCSKAWKRYSEALKAKKEPKDVKQKEATRKRKMDEVTELLAKKKRLQMDIDNLLTTADDVSEQAEAAKSTMQHDLLIRSNALRRDAKGRSQELDALSSLISQKQKEMA